MCELGVVFMVVEGCLADVEGAGGVGVVQGSSSMTVVVVGGREGGGRGMGTCCWGLAQN